MPRFSDSLLAILAPAFAVALVAVGILVWLCYRLLVDRGHLLARLERDAGAAQPALPDAPGLPPGAYLSDFALPALAGLPVEAGAPVTLSGLIGQSLLLVYLQPDCLFSRAFARELASQAPMPGAPLTVSIVVGKAEGSEALAPFAALPGIVLRDPYGQAARLALAKLTPAGYRVDAGRRTVGEMLRGPRALLGAARGEPLSDETATPPALTAIGLPASFAISPLLPGDAAPGFTLPSVTGGAWSLADHRGEQLTLLFADPACPPSRSLLERLGRRHVSGLVIVSRGDPGENARLLPELDIAAPLLVQQQREVARLYHLLDTPAAYAIDERGTIAAGPAVGADEVLALLAQRVVVERGNLAAEV